MVASKFHTKTIGLLRFPLYSPCQPLFMSLLDKISMMITVPEGELVWYGYDNEDNYIEPDFAIELNAFIIDYYPPKLALIDNQGKLVSPKLLSLIHI